MCRDGCAAQSSTRQVRLTLLNVVTINESERLSLWCSNQFMQSQYSSQYDNLSISVIVFFSHIRASVASSSPPGQNGLHFADGKIPLKFVHKGSINKNPAKVYIMAWRRIGDKPLSEPMLTWFTDAYRWHYGDWGRWVKAYPVNMPYCARTLATNAALGQFQSFSGTFWHVDSVATWNWYYVCSQCVSDWLVTP